MICLDTNLVYHFLFESKLTIQSEKVIYKGVIEGMAIPLIVYNELLYIIGAKIAKDMYGIIGKYTFRRFIARHGFPEKAITRINGFIRDFKITLLKDYQDSKELVKTIREYKLLPNDAQIVITCKYYNINTLASFDEDFKRVPWLNLIP